MRGIDDGVDPEARGGVARVGLLLVGRRTESTSSAADFFVEFLAFAFELLELDFDQRAGGGVAAHHRVTRRGPGKHEARIVGLAAHGVVAGAEAAAADHRNFRHHAIGHGVHHFRAGADDAAPFGFFADHEAVHVVQKNQRDEVLIAVEDEARGFFGGFGVDHAAEFDALLVGAAGLGLHVFFLVGDDTDGPAADARVAAEDRLAVFGAIFFEFAAVHDARDDFAHVVLLGGIAGENSVDFFGGIARVACG